MIRYTLLTLAVIFLCTYAFRDWYRSLCGLVVMMAVLERADMPTNMFGVPGLNPWNVIMLFILIAWATNAADANKLSQLPAKLRIGMHLYIVVILISAARMLSDVGGIYDFYFEVGIEPPSFQGLFLDSVVNSMKWLIPAFLIFKGNNSPERSYMALGAFAVCGLLFALQVVKQMPIGNLLDGTSLQQRAVRVLGRNIGYHRVDLAAILAGITWMYFAFSYYAKKRSMKLVFLFVSGLSFLALLLTGGRAGLAACVVVGFLLSVRLWRKMLIFGPLALVVALVAIPAVQERVFEGFTEDSYEQGTAGLGIDTVDDQGRDLYAITSGRVVVWPFIVDKIKEKPLTGYGQKAMLREGIATEIVSIFGRGVAFGHPHNAYLEWLLDTGLLGALPVFIFLISILKIAWFSLRSTRSEVESLAAVVCFAFVVSQLVASLGAQSFYPREGVVLMWCSIGLLLSIRFSVARLDSDNMDQSLALRKQDGGQRELTVR